MTHNIDIHPQPSITGGSSGFGLALARALADAGWDVVDRRPRRRPARAPRCDGTTVHGVAGDVDRRRPPRRAGRRRSTELGGLDLLVHNASTLGPLPCDRSPSYDAARARRGAGDQRGRAGRPDRSPLPALLRRERGPWSAISSDAAVEHYAGWGATARQGRARPPRAHLRRGDRPRDYAVDPGDMRTEMHQDAFPGEDISDRPLPGDGRAARCSGCSTQRPAVRALPGRRRWPCAAVARHDAAHSTARASGSTPPTSSTAPEPPEARGLARDEVRLLVARPDGIAHHRFATCPTSWSPATWWWSTTPRRSPASSTAYDAAAGRSCCTSATRLDDGTWVVELRTAPDAAEPMLDARAGEPSGSASSGDAARALPARPILAHRVGQPAVARSRRGRPAPLLDRHGRPIAYGYLAGRYPLADYQTVFAPCPAAPRCPAPAGRSPTRAGHRLVAARGRRRPDHAAHRRLVAGGRRGAAARVVRRAGADRAAGQHDPRPAGG